MKYVAFIDTLGFKNKISLLPHKEAVSAISNFNSEIYNLWKELAYNQLDSIRGRTFSDSLIINTQSTSESELIKLINFVKRLYRVSIIKCDLPLRGGIAVGEYDDVLVTEFDNLNKGVVVGEGYLKAYTLESNYNIKGSKILFNQDVKIDIERAFDKPDINKIKTDKSNESIYELKWADIQFLTNNSYQNLCKFVQLASDSKWLDHYYATLETFLLKEDADNKRDILIKIIFLINENYNHNVLDLFIENFMKSKSANYIKRSFLALIRNILL